MHINMELENAQAAASGGDSWYSPSRFSSRLKRKNSSRDPNDMRRMDSSRSTAGMLPDPEELREAGMSPYSDSSARSNPKDDLSTGGVPLSEFKPAGNPAVV